MKSITSHLLAKFPLLKELTPLIREFNPLTAEEVSWIEEQLQAQLPETYKTFLLQIGGAGLGAAFPTVEESYGGSHETIDRFFGAKAEQSYWLWNNISAWFESGLSQDLMPIGEDLFGNSICLGIKGKERGKVYFYDPGVGTAYLAAHSFEDFLSRLEKKNAAD